MSTASRVIKNTGFLYIKMGITAFVSLYTTRLILSSLGVADFGIYNVVGGAISMLGFLNSTLANATQRFMSYAEGEGNIEKKRKVFNVSVLIQLFVAVVTSLFLLCVMHPLFHGVLNIEPERIVAAKIVFISLIISTFLTIINVPYDAVMNAHENMLYYSIMGVFESLLRLLVALACVYSSDDKLIVYGLLMALIPLVTLSIMKIYCHKQYKECTFSPLTYWDISIAKSIASFSGWNFLTAISSLLTAQGLGLVLNHFFGTVLNAAQGIANQLNGQLSAFSTTMLKALNPVIVKSAGSMNIDEMNRIAMEGCKYSTILIMVFAIPFMIEMPYILGLWLSSIPEWSVLFCILQLLNTIICQMANPAATAVYAVGDIKQYAILKSVMNIMPIIITYICFRLGGSPIWLYIPMIVLWAIGGDMVVLYYAHKKCGMPLYLYFHKVTIPLSLVAITAIIIGYIPKCILLESLLRVFLTFSFTTIALILSVWFIMMGEKEKNFVVNLYKKVKNETVN